MSISPRRVLLVATITGGMVLGGAAPAFAQPGLDEVDLGEVTDLVPAQEQGPLQPVTDLVCQLTSNQLELLGQCPAEVVEEAPVVEEKEPAKPHVPGGGKHKAGGKHVSDDKGAAPVGGVETGAGGTAGDGPDLTLPLGLLGGAALAGATIAGARRLPGRQDG